MSETTGEGLAYSLTDLSNELGASRDTIKRKLIQSGARPTKAGKWRLRDAAYALYPETINRGLAEAIAVDRALARVRYAANELGACRLSPAAQKKLEALREVIGHD